MTDVAFLSGAGLILRPIVAVDLNETYLAWLNDPEIGRYSRRHYLPTGPEELAFKPGKDALHLAICVAEDGRHVGNLALAPINWLNRWAELTIMVGDKSVWGKGVATRAMYLVSRHAFLELGLHRLEARSCNPAFNAAVTRLGWRQEGVLRERFRVNGTMLDIVCTAQLASEFRLRPDLETP